ncbi:MAG: hypothetical protein OHK0029_03450 [Armatimonadaceae bacterium]
MNYNRIILVGRLTRDPEARITPAGLPVTTFGLAVNRPRSAQSDRPEEVDYFNIVTWRQTAEYAANYLNKGRLVLVEGRLQIRDYTNRDGQPAKAIEVVADTVQNLERRADSMVGEEGEAGGYEAAPAPSQGRASNGQAGGGSGGGRGGYDRAQSGRGGYEQQAPQGNRGGGNRGVRPAQSADNFGEDYDDPFSDE